MTKLVYDIDFLVFEAVSVAEEKYIVATHTPTGKVFEFDNKTALWGHHLKKEGGFIGKTNKFNGEIIYKAEDFIVEAKQRPRPFKMKGDPENEIEDYFITPFDGAKKILNDKIASINKKLDATEYKAFTGEGEVFRHEVATLLPYKGNRDDMLTPLLLKEMKQYVQDKQFCELVKGIEADDAVTMAVLEGYNHWKANGCKDEDRVIGIAVDKDSDGCTGWWYNPDKDSEPRLIQGFGKLWLDSKGKPRGEGRLWFYYQIAVGDQSDNYKSNCFSEIEYGLMGGYNDLKDVTNDKEAFTALVAIFKRLYPEAKTVEGCKGPAKIDAMYVMQEMATLALMLRKPGDSIDVKAVCDKLGVAYD